MPPPTPPFPTCSPHHPALTSCAVTCGGQAVSAAHTAVTTVPVSRPSVCYTSTPLDITHQLAGTWAKQGWSGQPSYLMCVYKSQVDPSCHQHLSGSFTGNQSCCQCFLAGFLFTLLLLSDKQYWWAAQQWLTVCMECICTTSPLGGETGHSVCWVWQKWFPAITAPHTIPSAAHMIRQPCTGGSSHSWTKHLLKARWCNRGEPVHTHILQWAHCL